MNDIGIQITDLIKAKGKSASEMTHALKFIGDGNMQDGITRITDSLMKKGQRNGVIKGAIGGVTITLLVVGLIHFIRDKIKENRSLKAEGEAILKGLNEGLSDIVNQAGEESLCDSGVEEKKHAIVSSTLPVDLSY